MQDKHTIAVLGAGIMGLMAARALADTHHVTLYDPKGFPANNASFIAGGMLAPYSEIEHMDLRWVQAGLDSIALWRDAADLQTGFTQNGSLLLAHPDDRHILNRFRAHLPQDLRDNRAVAELEPVLAPRYESGLFLPAEAHLDPERTMSALCTHIKDRATLRAEAADPETLRADLIIDCRGLGADDPALRGVKGEIALVRNTEFRLSRPVRLMHPRYPLYVVPRANDVFMIGATLVESAEGENVSLRSAMELLSALYALSPSFAEAEILHIKAGIRPSYPDNLPRISQSGRIISCNGLFRHGYLLAPLMADIVKALAAGADHPYKPLFMREDHDDNHHTQRAA